jgi:hypothetical protein
MLGNVPSAIPGTMGTRTVSEKAGGIFTNVWQYGMKRIASDKVSRQDKLGTG